MEEQFKDFDKKTQKLIKEAGTYKPSANFLSNVMSTIENKATRQVYKPLISRTSWFVIGGLLVVWMLVAYLYPSSYSSVFKEFNLTEKLAIENPFAVVEFSKILMYGLGFLGLFLVQVPFLKRYMEKWKFD
jgi:hypothetical protein